MTKLVLLDLWLFILATVGYYYYHCDCCSDNSHCGHCGHCGHDPHCGSCPCDDDCCCQHTGLRRLWCAIKKTVHLYATLLRIMHKGEKKAVSLLSNETELLHPAPANHARPRIAFISNYGTHCGIATYNEALLNEVRLYADVKVFAEYADEDRSANIEGDPSWVTRCWHRKEHPKSNLIKQVIAWKPDIAHFSHEYGLWPRAFQFTQIVSALRMNGIKVLGTMHSVYDHQDKLVSEAVLPNVMVHTYQARVVLVKKGIAPERINVIPHGSNIYAGTSDSPKLLEQLWNTWGSEHTIYQPGFLFGYKGHMRMLGVVARLKEKYEDVHYVIQASENPNTMAEHDEIYNQLIAECERLDISGNVTINRGFVSEDVLMSNIRTVKVCVLPYCNHPDHDVRATSGIARMILGTQTPLVVTGVHLFDDLEGIVPRARDDQELYEAVDNIFDNKGATEAEVSKRTEFLRKTSWESVAQRLAALYNRILDR